MNTQHLTWTLCLALLLGALTVSPTAWAHGAEHDAVPLHVGDAHGSCYFDLHPELTPRQFRRFAAEGGQLSQFRTLSSAEVLGPWRFDVALALTHSYIDDGAGAWNHTMTHPQGDHFLGEEITIPRLMLRFGLTERVDVEVSGTVDPRANYGFVGIGAKVALMQPRQGAPVSLSLRPAVSTMLGPAEVSLASFSTELLLSRRFYGWAPFVGLGVRGTLAIDHSADADVGTQGAVRPVLLAGLDYTWQALSLGAPVDYSAVVTLAARAGARF